MGKAYGIQKIPDIDNIINPSCKPVISIFVPEALMCTT